MITMMRHMKPIGGALMAAVLVMGMLSRASFMEAASRVTITKGMLRMKNASCRLYVDGEEQELIPGVYENALLLVKEDYRTNTVKTKIGKIHGASHSHYGLFVDA